MTKTTALDVNRRGFLGMLFGAAAAVVVAPVLAKVAVVAESRWGSLLRGLRSDNPVTKVVGQLSPSSLADAFAQVERWDLPVSRVLVHPDDYKDFLVYGHNVVDDRGREPSVWGATVHVTNDVERHKAWVLGSPANPRGVAEIRVIA